MEKNGRINWTTLIAGIVGLCTIIGTNKYFISGVEEDLKEHLEHGAHFEAAADIAEIKAELKWIKYHLKKKEGRHGI